ncbi:MAG: sulfotransferase [Pseudomonadales bacterium]
MTRVWITIELVRLPQARLAYEQILASAPNDAVAMQLLGLTEFQQGDFSVAEELFRRAISLKPDYGEAHHNLARLLESTGDFDSSIQYYQLASALLPDNADTRASLANVCKIAGRLGDAVLHFKATLAINPGYCDAHRQLAMLVKHTEYDAHMKTMESLLSAAGIPPNSKMHLHFGLGKSFEDLHRYDEAFRHFEQANNIMRSQLDFDILDWEHDVKEQIKFFTPPFFEQTSKAGDPVATPIFILGMPRSGTSLVEQILSSHSDVYGAGEIQSLGSVINKHVDTLKYPNVLLETTADDLKPMAEQYLAEVSASAGMARYTTNKQPDNFKFVGMIKLIFPNARIIHCYRNPQDNCLSLYKNHFSQNGPYYSYQLSELARYYNAYSTLMNHWQTVLPDFMLQFRYEELVGDLEVQSRRLLDYCG